jgi:EmrB/QacA subfamily drug resistance transporter
MAPTPESFETARERGSGTSQHHAVPESHYFVGDVVENITNEPYREPSFDHQRQTELDRTYSVLTRNESVRRMDSQETLRRTALERESFQQADVIAELIHSLRNSEMDADSMHRRNASSYSFEPIELEQLEGATPVEPQSRNMSSLSHYTHHSNHDSYLPHDSLPVKKPYTASNTDSAVSLGAPSLPMKKKRASSASRHPLSMSATPPEDDPVRDEPAEPELPPREPPQTQYPPPAKLALILISLYIGIFLVALDRTIMGPAIPEITNQFHSLGDVGWYGSAYMLTSCGFILLYGRLYTFFSTKMIFLTAVSLFEVGSAVCGAASSSTILIVGRAIAGIGASGIFTGAILIILEIVPLHRRPLLQGLFGACFGVASVAGPLLGGVFTGSKALTWRWCFYINLPLGGVTILVTVLFLKLNETKTRNGWKDTVKRLDPIGTILFLPSITCLLLALEWGAADYEWSDPIIIALLTVFAILLVAFVAWQGYTRHTTATVPARIAFQRSVAFGGLSQFAVGSTMLTVSMYIPLWFQAIDNVSAMQSGIRTIPLVLSVVVGSIVSGGGTQKIGYYTPFMIAGSVLMSVGAGLLTTWNTHISSGIWIGYQIMLGLGVGFTMQHPNLAIQIVLEKPDIPTGTALLSLCQTLGGAVFVAVGQNTFIDKFLAGLMAIPGIKDPHRLVEAGATDLTTMVPAGVRDAVLEAYNNSLTKGPFFACMIVACLTVPAALGMEWRSVKEGMQQPPQQRPSSQNDEEAAITSSPVMRSRATTLDVAESHMQKDDLESLQPPNPRYSGWRNSYRMVGDFSWVLIKRMNRDIKEDLDNPARRGGVR